MARLPKANFQSYATGRSNKAVQMPYGLLNRINERDQTVIRGMKEQESRREALAKQDISNTAETFRKAEANTKEIKGFEDKAIATREAAEERRFRSEQRSLQQEKDNATAFASSIQNLSTTWAASLMKLGEIKDENDASEAYTKAWNEGIPKEREIVRDNAELLLENSEKITSDLALRVQQTGAPFWIVQALNGDNKAQAYGRMKAYSEMSAADWPVFFQKALTERNLSKASEIDAILPSLRDEFLKERGLFGLSADFMGPMFQKMKQSTNALLNTARLEEGKDIANGVVDTQSHLFRHQLKDRGVIDVEPDYFNSTLTKLMGMVNPDSLKAGGFNRNYTRTEALDLIFSWLEDVTQVPGDDDEIIDLLKKQVIIDDNGKPISTWDIRHSIRLDELLSKRSLNRAADNRAHTTEQKSNQIKFEKLAEEKLLSIEGGFDARAVDKIVQIGKNQGFDTSKFEARLYAQSIDGINEAYWNQYFGDLERDGLLTTAELNEPWVPSTVVAAFQEKAKAQDELNMAAIGTSDTLESSLNKLLKGNLKIESTTAISDSSLDLAEYRAFRRFKRYVKDFLDKDEASTQAVSKAWDKINKEIKEGKNDPSSLWHVTPAAERKEGTGGKAYFTNFNFGENDDKDTDKVLINPHKVKPTVSADQVRNWDKEVIIKDSLLGLVDHQVNNNSMITVSKTVYDLVEVLNADKPLEEQVTVIDVLNTQLKLGGYSTQIKTDWRKDLLHRAGEASNMDPGILKLVRDIRTPAQLYNLQLALTPSPEGFKRNPANMSANLSSNYIDIMKQVKTVEDLNKLNIDQLQTIVENNDPTVTPGVESVNSPITEEEWNQFYPEKSKSGKDPLTWEDRTTNWTQRLGGNIGSNDLLEYTNE